jgi:sugar phosphate isomerase/epimerase
MSWPSPLRRAARGLLVAGVLSAAVAGWAGASPANAASDAGCSPDWQLNGRTHGGPGIPNSKISIQLFNFVGYIYFGDPATTDQRVEEVLRRLSEMGYRHVELFSFTQPFSVGSYDAEELAALLKKYHLKATAAHGSMAEATFDQTLADAKTLGQQFVGSGGWPAPGIGSYENVLATADALNRLGRLSVQNGTGKVYGHNHQQEFRTTYADPVTGEVKTAWQILVENTDPRWVAMELDVLWASDAGQDPAALIERYGNRIDLLHMKDGINVAAPANATPVGPGEGEIDFLPILQAAHGKIAQYIFEQDPPLFPPDPTFDPFEQAQLGWEFLSCVRY